MNGTNTGVATDVVTGVLGTRLFLADGLPPQMPPHVIHTGYNEKDVTDALEERRAAWVEFDKDDVFKLMTGFDTIPDINSVFDMNEFTDVSNGLKLPYKGAVSAGESDMNVATKENDEGQKIFRKYGNSRMPCSFRIDRPNGSRDYFTALIGGFGTSGGDANAVMQTPAPIRLTDFPVNIPSDWKPANTNTGTGGTGTGGTGTGGTDPDPTDPDPTDP